MRLWKAGGAALILASAAFMMPAGVTAHEQVFARPRQGEPAQRAFELLTAGSGSRIGVRIDDVGAADVTSKKLSGEAGAVIEEVEEGMPAAKAGFKAGDVVLEFDGERVRSASQLTRLIQETPSGRKVAVVISRDGQRMNLSVEPEASERIRAIAPSLRLDTMPAPRVRTPQVLRKPTPDVRVMPSVPRLEVFRDGFAYSFGGGRLGVGTETLGGQLAKHFGVERGVLVKEVFDDSAASKAGLRAGDVITKVNGKTVDDSGDLLTALGDVSGEVTIEIVRDRKPQTLKATIDAPRARTIRRVG